MDNENLRINMVVNRFEHPHLFAFLNANPPKIRASLLRQFADFGMWIKNNGNCVSMSSSGLQTNDSIKKVIHSSSFNNKEQSFTLNNTRPTTNNSDLDLDTSILSNVDLSDLD